MHVVHQTQLCKEQYFSKRCTALECNHSQCISVVHQTQLCKEQYFSKRCTALEFSQFARNNTSVIDATTHNVSVWYTRHNFARNNTSVIDVLHWNVIAHNVSMWYTRHSFARNNTSVKDVLHWNVTTHNVLMWYTRHSFARNNTSVKGVQCSFVSVLKVTLCSVYCGCTLYTINTTSQVCCAGLVLQLKKGAWNTRFAGRDTCGSR